MEIRTRYRAVTKEDFEFLSGEASPRVARVVCVSPNGDGIARVHIVPRVEPPDRKRELVALTRAQALLAHVASSLDTVFLSAVPIVALAFAFSLLLPEVPLRER